MGSMTLAALYVATFVNAAMPRPCVVLAASRTARGGVRSGLLVSVGVIAGIACLTLLAFGVLLGFFSLSRPVLGAIKWAGVAALLVLAARGLRPASGGVSFRGAGYGDFGAGAVIVVTSPSVIVFLLALLPQFLPAEATDLGPAVLGAGVFVAGVAVGQGAAIVFARCLARPGAASSRWVERAGSVMLAGFAGAAVFAGLG